MKSHEYTTNNIENAEQAENEKIHGSLSRKFRLQVD